MQERACIMLWLALTATLLVLCGCGNAAAATTPVNTNTINQTHVLVNATTIKLMPTTQTQQFPKTNISNSNHNNQNNNNNNQNNHHYNYAQGNHFKYPCAFIDTVNISANYQLYDVPEDNVYVHETLRIPPDLVAIYDFVIVNGGRVPAERHLRACICRVKPCVRYCCAPGQYYDLANRTCTAIGATDAVSATLTLDDDVDDEVADVGVGDGVGVDQPIGVGAWQTMHVWQTNGTGSVRINASAHFVVHTGAPCAKMRLVTKDNKQLVPWRLYENGSIAYEHHFFSKHYCYTPFYISATKHYNNNNNNNNNGEQFTTATTATTNGMGQGSWEWQPLACAIEKFPFVLGVTEWTYAICLIIAVICMFTTLFVHLLCNELRNTFYGIAIKSYTICIIIGYALLAHLTLTNPAHLARARCSNIACCILLFVLLSFLLLCFISFNFYLNYHGITLTKPMFWLILCPLVLLAVGWALYARFDHFGGKPVFGHETCWFDPRNFSILAYFYAPILFACLICIFFYAVTLLHISERSASELNKLTSEVDENRFKMFWSFFGYTFAAWLVCLISFAMHYYLGQPTHINYLVCLFIALHGFGALYTLVAKNLQIQNFLRRMQSDDDDHNADDDDEQRAAVAAVLAAQMYEEAMHDDDDFDSDDLSAAAAVHNVPMKHF